MGYFIKKAFDKNTGKEVNFPDKVVDAAGNEFYFRWVESLDEVCVSETDGKDVNGLHNGKPEEYGLIVKEVEMPDGYNFAIYTYTMLGDDVHHIEPYDVKFHGFIEIFTRQKLKVTNDIAEKMEEAAKNYAVEKENAVRQELLDILSRQRNSGCYLSGKSVDIISGCCAIKVGIMPHTNYNFDWAVGNTDLIECIRKRYDLFREQISRGNYRTAYPIILDEEGGEE